MKLKNLMMLCGVSLLFTGSLQAVTYSIKDLPLYVNKVLSDEKITSLSLTGDIGGCFNPLPGMDACISNAAVVVSKCNKYGCHPETCVTDKDTTIIDGKDDKAEITIKALRCRYDLTLDVVLRIAAFCEKKSGAIENHIQSAMLYWNRDKNPDVESAYYGSAAKMSVVKVK